MFQADKLYPATEPGLTGALGFTYQTMAHWRVEGRGPAYVKFGQRIFYKGSDLNSWIEKNTIQPTDSRGPRAARKDR